MKLTSRLGAKRFLLVVAVFSFLAIPVYTFELLSGAKPFDLQITGIANLSTPLYCLAEGIVMIILAKDLAKKAPANLAKRTGIYELSTMPWLAILVMVLCLFYPPAISSWLYFLNLGVTLVLFGLRIALSIYFDQIIETSGGGYVVLRNHSLIGVGFFLMVLLYYLLPYLKTIGFDGGSLIEIIARDGNLSSLPIPYLLTSLAELLIAIGVLMAMVYLALANFISGRENKAFDLKGNFAVTKELLIKYDIVFWVGIASTAVLLLLSLTSSIGLMGSYLTLSFLYLMTIAIKVPNYFYRRKKVIAYGNDHYGCFKAEHKMFIYSSIWLFAYIVFSEVFGSVSATKQDANQSALLTFVIFIPLAIIKMYLGIKKYLKARKNGEPYDLLNAYLDILFAIFTFSNTSMIVGNATGVDTFKLVGIIVASAMSLYTLYLAIKLLVIGIRGIKGKRLAYYNSHKAVMDKEGFKLAEDLYKQERKQRKKRS